MALRFRVCELVDVEDGSMGAFEVEGIANPVLVVRQGGRVRATNGICPHEDVALADGSLRKNRVVCPGHGYQFDLDNGRCQHDPDLVLSVYRATVEDGVVFVELI